MSARLPWARLATDYYLDAKVRRLSPEAEVLYVRAIAWTVREATDGAVPAAALETIGVRLSDPRGAARELVVTRLWQRKGRGWTFPSEQWAYWQRTRSERESSRKSANERNKRWREAKARRVSDASRDALVTSREEEGDRERDLSPTTSSPRAYAREAPTPNRDLESTVNGLADRLRLTDEVTRDP